MQHEVRVGSRDVIEFDGSQRLGGLQIVLTVVRYGLPAEDKVSLLPSTPKKKTRNQNRTMVRRCQWEELTNRTRPPS